MKKAVCFGEILWDIFPDYKKIGGAPLNVAYRLQSLEIDTTIISKIGNDNNGKEILKKMKKMNIDIKNIQTGEEPTGEAIVKLDDGNTFYEIKEPAAWDKIVITKENKEITSESDAFIFGSIIARNIVSQNTLLALLDIAKFKVFDINIRPPHYDIKILYTLMEKADFIKFNTEEIYKISNLLGSPFHSLEQNIFFISKKTNTNQICVTNGKYGAVLMIDNKLHYNNGFNTDVKDTVGAGDTFLATLIKKLTSGSPPKESVDIACAMGALVTTHKGANPEITEKELSNFMHTNIINT